VTLASLPNLKSIVASADLCFFAYSAISIRDSRSDGGKATKAGAVGCCDAYSRM